MSCTITWMPDPFDAERRVVEVVDAGLRLGDLAADYEDSAVASINGIPVSIKHVRDYRLKEGDFVGVVNMPKGPLIAALPYILIAAVSAYIAYRLMLPGEEPDIRGDQGSPTYAFNGIGNNRAEGYPIPIVYGQHRTGGTIISEYGTLMGQDRMVINQMIAVSEGPIAGIGTVQAIASTASSGPLSGGDIPLGVQIDDVEAQTLADSDIQFRPGSLTQTPMEGFNAILFETPQDVVLTGTEITGNTISSMFPAQAGFGDTASTGYADMLAAFDQYGHTFDVTGSNYDSCTVRVSLPDGLAYIDPSGNYFDRTLYFAIRYRRLDPSGIPINTGGRNNDGYAYAPPFSITAATSKTQFKEYNFTFSDPQTQTAGVGVSKIYKSPSTGAPTAGVLEADMSLIDWRTRDQVRINANFGGLNTTYNGRSTFFGAAGGRDFMSPFVAGIDFKVDVDRAATAQSVLLEGITLMSVGESYNGFSITLAATPGGQIAVGVNVRNSYDSGFFWNQQHLVNGYQSGDRLKVALSFEVQEESYPVNNHTSNPQSNGSGVLHTVRWQLWVNGSVVAYTYWYDQYGQDWIDDFGYFPAARVPAPSQPLTIRTNDAIDIEEAYYIPIGFQSNLYNQGTIYEDHVAPLDSGVAINQSAHSFLYRFDSNSSLGAYNVSNDTSFGQYAGALTAVTNGLATIGVEDGWVTSPGVLGSLLPGQYRVEIVRVNKFSTEDRVRNKSVFTAFTAIENKQLGYPSMALVGHSTRATDQLSGSIPKFTAVVNGRLVPVWRGANPVYQYSANPAWVALDILTNKRYGLGNRYSVGSIDQQSLVEWADYCDDLVYDGSPAYGMDNGGLTNPTDFDNLVFYNDTATDFGYVRGSLELYVKKTSTDVATIYAEGAFVRLHGWPLPAGATTDINQGASGSATPGGYEVKSIEEDPANDLRWKIVLWWDRLDEDDPWTSGSDLVTELAPGGGQYDITGAIVEGAERRFEFNGVFDKEQPAWDALIAVCKCGMARPILVGKSVRFSHDRSRAAVGMIGMGAIVKDSFEMNYISPKSKANSIEAVIFDRNANWERSVDIVNDPDILNPTQFDDFRRESQQMFGVTSRGQARRAANFTILSNKLRVRAGSLKCGPEALAFEPGDVVYLAHDIVPRGVSGRVLSIDGGSPTTEFEVDSPFSIDTTKTYKVFIHDAVSDTLKRVDLTAINGGAIANGDYPAGTTIEFAEGIPFDVIPGQTTYMLAASGDELQVEIINIKLDEDLTHTVEFLEYNAEVYNDTIQEVITGGLPAFGAGIDTGGANNPGKPLAVSNVSVSEMYERAGGDQYRPSVEISWTLPKNARSKVRGYRVYQRRHPVTGSTYYRSDDIDMGNYDVVGEGIGAKTSCIVPILNMAPRSEVEYRVYLYGDWPSVPPDLCEPALLFYTGVTPKPNQPQSAAIRFNEERATYYSRQASSNLRDQIEWRRGSWILGDRIGRMAPGEPAFGPTDNWAQAVSGDTRVFAATVTNTGSYSDPLEITDTYTPRSDQIAFDATWAEQAWETYVDGWKTDSLPPAYDPQLSNLVRNADGNLEFTGTSLTGTYTTANELSPIRYDQVIRPVRCFIQVYWEAGQEHPASWESFNRLTWPDNATRQWTWEGPIADGVYEVDNCRIECEARFSEDGSTWGDWLPFTPGLYAISAVQFRLNVTRLRGDFNVQISKFHTKIIQRYRTITDRDRMTAFIEREII